MENSFGEATGGTWTCTRPFGTETTDPPPPPPTPCPPSCNLVASYVARLCASIHSYEPHLIVRSLDSENGSIVNRNLPTASPKVRGGRARERKERRALPPGGRPGPNPVPPGTWNPEPGTRNPEPGIRNPESGTRNLEPENPKAQPLLPAPCTLRPKPKTQKTAPQTSNPEPQTFNLEPYNLHQETAGAYPGCCYPGVIP